MKIIRQNILPLGKKFSAINLFGILFVKKNVTVSPELVNHERIHTAQLRELGYIFFYILYLNEWIIRLVQNRFKPYSAYRAISFEREAYRHDKDLSYLKRRRKFAMWRKESQVSSDRNY